MKFRLSGLSLEQCTSTGNPGAISAARLSCRIASGVFFAYPNCPPIEVQIAWVVRLVLEILHEKRRQRSRPRPVWRKIQKSLEQKEVMCSGTRARLRFSQAEIVNLCRLNARKARTLGGGDEPGKHEQDGQSCNRAGHISSLDAALERDVKSAPIKQLV